MHSENITVDPSTDLNTSAKIVLYIVHGNGLIYRMKSS